MNTDTQDGSPAEAEEQDSSVQSGQEDALRGPDHVNTNQEPPVEDTPDGGGEQVPAKRYKDLQAAFTRTSQENSELRSKLDQLSGKVEAMMATVHPRQEEKPSDPLDFLVSKELEDEVLDNPATALKAIRKTADLVRSQVAQLLDLRDRALMESLKRQDPRIEENADEIRELRKDPRLANAPDEVLMAFVERSKPPEERPVPRGGIAAGRRPAEQNKTPSIKDHPLYKRIYGTAPLEVI
jgi:hypothetical protein